MSDILDGIEGHTPGPWLVEDGNFVYALTEAGVNDFCAPVQRGAGTPPERIEANANLIARAPDLVDEVVRLRHEAERLKSMLTLEEYDAYRSVGGRWVKFNSRRHG